MLRTHVIAVLESQGVRDTTSDDLVRNGLKKAGWKPPQIEEGIKALHSPLSEALNELTESESLIYTDKPLSHDMISRLLKIDVAALPPHTRSRERENMRVREEDSFDYTFLAIAVAIVGAFLFGGAYLYAFEMGPFFTMTGATL